MSELTVPQVELVAKLVELDHHWWLESNASALCEECGQRVNVGDEFGELGPLVALMLAHANECYLARPTG